ncbi:MAG TPA: hypothetical protein VHK65_15230 [Candidatus Dormibacteraeota bacterium]|nr:hypothetical protein [Candidatus Dormibacteraeota bacterium]
MNMRLLPILGITGLFSIALAGSAVAGGGGWPPAPGTYKTTDTSATADLVGATTTVCYPQKGCYPQPTEFAYVSVDRGLHTFKPRGGETLVQQTGTMLNFYFYTASGTNASGCWIIADDDFTVAKDLSSASLVTTVQGESNCPGTPLAVSSTNVVTGKGGGGGGGGSMGSVTLNLSWTYNGVVSHTRDDGTLTCGDFKTVAKQDLSHASATSQGQITGATATLTSQFASIDDSSSNQVVRGVPVKACFS